MVSSRAVTPLDWKISEAATKFMGMAVLMLNGTLAEFNSLIPPDLAIWFAGLEDQLIGLFS